MQKIGEAYLEMNGINSEYDTEALAWFIASEHVIYTRFGPQFGYGMGPQIDAMTISNEIERHSRGEAAGGENNRNRHPRHR
jgi:hypothetical protein